MRSYGKFPSVLLLAILFCTGCATSTSSKSDESYLTAAVAQAFWFSETPPAATYPTGVPEADKVLAPLPPETRERVILRAARSLQTVRP